MTLKGTEQMISTKKLGPFEFGPSRYQPDPDHIIGTRPQYELNQRWLALWVGAIAVGLPFVLLLSSYTGFGVCPLDSISHYYYAKIIGDVFVGCLIFIGAFLIAYQGDSRPESILANITGAAAIGVAIFPTAENGCNGKRFSSRVFTDSSGGTLNAELYSLFPHVGIVHYICAATVFGFIAFYTLCVFTRVDKSKKQRLSDTKLTLEKSRRNMVYATSGVLIIFSISALLYKAVFGPDWWNDYNLTFLFEAIALISFGVSWLVKSRFRFFGLIDLNDPE